MIKKIFPHAAVLFMFCTCMYLGIWQVQRMQWKNDLLEKITQNMETIILPSEFKNMEDDEFKLVEISGVYDHEKTIQLLSRTHNGKAGTHVLTPLKTDSGTYIINRGWVKADEDFIKPEGVIKVSGVIRKSHQPGWLALENDLVKNHWFWIDLPTIYNHINAPEKPHYLDRVDDDKQYPVALPKEIKLHNEHLQYVITWFSLAFALVVMYYFRFWKK